MEENINESTRYLAVYRYVGIGGPEQNLLDFGETKPLLEDVACSCVVKSGPIKYIGREGKVSLEKHLEDIGATKIDMKILSMGSFSCSDVSLYGYREKQSEKESVGRAYN